jgi:hypothetical protein
LHPPNWIATSLFINAFGRNAHLYFRLIRAVPGLFAAAMYDMDW